MKHFDLSPWFDLTHHRSMLGLFIPLSSALSNFGGTRKLSIQKGLKTINLRLLFIGYLLVIIGLFLYSFTQVDLNLTLSRWWGEQVFQKFFQNIGYFQRPLSSFFYIAIVLLLYIFYFLFLHLAKIGKIREIREVWKLIILTTIILAFSYNAFSYDLFNYIFDAKIVTHYDQNPYLHKALDYPGDPMLSFMHSTHRPYPYGPTWLGLTVPLSFLGFNIFLFTLYLFKALIAASFLGTVYFIGKIIKKISPQKEIFGMIFFAMNPLVIIESLVSAHNDIVMIFLSLCSLYLLMNRNYTRSFILLILSIGIKFATILLLPVFIYIAIKQFRNQAIDFKRVFMVIFILMCAAVAITSFASGTNKNTELQPWYFLMAIPFAALIAQKRIAVLLTICISFGILVSYIPFLLTGEWPKDIVELKIKLLIFSISIGIFLFLLSSKRVYSALKRILSSV